MANQDQWCFAWMDHGVKAAGAERAALIRGARWPLGSILTISFLDGDPALQLRVKRAALKWVAPGLANLRFDFRKQSNTLIRISFRFKGSWSLVGTRCKASTDLSQPTMNFGWLTPNTTDEKLERVVLHEFGHALGLIHEHQNPAGGIQWDRDAVFADLLGPPNNWSKEKIERNLFEPYDKQETNFTAVDAESIMMYPIPANWTQDGFSADLNAQLSDTDRSFIRSQYP